MIKFTPGAEVELINAKSCTSSRKGDRLILLSICTGSSDPETNPTWAVYRLRDKKETNLKQCRFKLTGQYYTMSGDCWTREFALIHRSNMSQEQRINGWVNEETNEAAMVFFNDSNRLRYVKEQLLSLRHISVRQAANMVRNIDLSCGDIKDVCIRSILEEWINNYQQRNAEDVAKSRIDAILNDIACEFDYVEPSLEHQAQDIADTIQRAANSFQKVADDLKQPKKVPKPKEAKKLMMKIETRHYVNGEELASMSTEQRIALIAKTEKHIEELKSVKTKSKLITTEIEKAEKFLADAVKLFDGE